MHTCIYFRLPNDRGSSASNCPVSYWGSVCFITIVAQNFSRPRYESRNVETGDLDIWTIHQKHVASVSKISCLDRKRRTSGVETNPEKAGVQNFQKRITI